MITELTVSLTMSEIAAISQRAICERIASIDGGVWQTLWEKVESAIERVEAQQRSGKK